MPHAKTTSGTAQRLILAFGSLVILFGATIVFALVGVIDVHDSLHHVEANSVQACAALEAGLSLQAANAALRRDDDGTQRPMAALDDGAAQRYRRALARWGRARETARPDHLSPQQLRWLQDLDTAAADIQAFATGQATELPQTLPAATRASHQLSDSILSSGGDLAAHAELVQHRTILFALILMCASVLLALLIGVYLQRSVAHPVALLTQGAAQLAEGDLTTRIKITSADEFGELARQFNAMTIALARNQERLIQGENLAAVGRLAAGVAHELNNPLAVILGYVRVLRGKTTDDLAEDMLVIEEEALRCQEIVEGLLDISRPSKAGSAEVDLRGICEEVVLRLDEVGHLYDLDVEVTGQGTVQGHPVKLRQIVANLVRNAVEASPPGGHVGIRLAPDGQGNTVLEVRDEGEGISEEARPRLFEPFFTTKSDGTGLGLAVSQAIAVAHGGSIEVSDADPGAVFTFRCPRQRREVLHV